MLGCQNRRDWGCTHGTGALPLLARQLNDTFFEEGIEKSKLLKAHEVLAIIELSPETLGELCSVLPDSDTRFPDGRCDRIIAFVRKSGLLPLPKFESEAVEDDDMQ